MVTVHYSLWAKCTQLWPLKVREYLLFHTKTEKGWCASIAYTFCMPMGYYTHVENLPQDFHREGEMDWHIEQPSRGVLPLNRVKDSKYVAVKTLFSNPSAAQQDPLFNIFQFHKTLFEQKITHHFLILRSKCLILANFQFLILKVKIQFRKPQFGPKSVRKQQFFKKDQFSKSLNLARIRSTSPHFRSFGPLTHRPSQIKVKYPRATLSKVGTIHTHTLCATCLLRES